MIATRRRHLFAFCNGIYNVATDRFHVVDDVCTTAPMIDGVAPSLGTDAGVHYDRYTKVAQRFDESFGVDAQAAWHELRDPIVDTLLDTQRIDGETRWHVWAALGRLLYHVNELDRWERTLVITGPSPCGLGVLVRRVAALYAADHTLMCPSLSRHLDQTMGASVDKMLVVEDVGMERAAHNRSTLPAEWFVRMTSGAAMPTHSLPPAADPWALDHLSMSTAEALPTHEWRAPMLYVANALAPWMHKRHVLRRLFYVPFAQRIADDALDPNLLRDAQRHMATFVVKANRAYRALVVQQRRHHGEQCPFASLTSESTEQEGALV